MKSWSQPVVYFDQQTHACACVHMVENNEKCLKIINKYFFITGMRDSHKAHAKTGRKMKFISFFDNFQAFFIVFDHVNACERMRKHSFAG